MKTKTKRKRMGRPSLGGEKLLKGPPLFLLSREWDALEAAVQKEGQPGIPQLARQILRNWLAARETCLVKSNSSKE